MSSKSKSAEDFTFFLIDLINDFMINTNITQLQAVIIIGPKIFSYALRYYVLQMKHIYIF